MSKERNIARTLFKIIKNTTLGAIALTQIVSTPIFAEEDCGFCDEMKKPYLFIGRHLDRTRYAFCKDDEGNEYIDYGNDGTLDFVYKIISCDCSEEKITHILIEPGAEGWLEFQKNYRKIREKSRTPFDIIKSNPVKTI